ncbi:MAG: histidine kinase dimerization/phosphoacceptor domain -containing protein [Candidatus Methanoperedens sp.]|nr:histidine kinase dimerization/phosphoacceptor domain -containing protein [Candidatus Methanoperedens sp.]
MGVKRQKDANHIVCPNCKIAKKALKDSELHYRRLFENVQDGILILKGETGDIIDANPFLINMLGYSHEELLCMKLWEFCIVEDVMKIKAGFLNIQKKGYVKFEQLHFKTKSGRCIDVELIGDFNMFDRTEVITCGIHDITRGREAHEQTRASLREKEILLQEIHHRVKNNMQIISSLLRLQSKYIKEKKYHVLFEESQNMIRSMSLIHEKLYNSRDLSRIDFKDYIKDLVTNLFRSYDVNGSAIRSRIDIEDISPGMDLAIPCGLIINELVTNSLKYAFPDGRKGEINIAFRQNNSNIYELLVGDNGVGISNNLDINNTDSLGLRLVTMLVNDQLEGEIDLKRDNGTNFSIKFKGEN